MRSHCWPAPLHFASSAFYHTPLRPISLLLQRHKHTSSTKAGHAKDMASEGRHHARQNHQMGTKGSSSMFKGMGRLSDRPIWSSRGAKCGAFGFIECKVRILSIWSVHTKGGKTFLPHAVCPAKFLPQTSNGRKSMWPTKLPGDEGRQARSSRQLQLTRAHTVGRRGTATARAASTAQERVQGGNG